MDKLLNALSEMEAPSAADSCIAGESSRQLSKIPDALQKSIQIRIQLDGGAEENIAIPLSAFHLLTDILAQMAEGNAVTLVAVPIELTGQQAADLLNVSRPYLNALLEKGAIPFHETRTQRRILLHDLMIYKRNIDTQRLKALEELSAVDQELGFGY